MRLNQVELVTQSEVKIDLLQPECLVHRPVGESFANAWKQERLERLAKVVLPYLVKFSCIRYQRICVLLIPNFKLTNSLLHFFPVGFQQAHTQTNSCFVRIDVRPSVNDF